MYLTLGSDVMVRKKDIIGIFDLDKIEVDTGAMDFLRVCEEKKQVTVVGDGIPKAFVVVNNGGVDHVYITTVSAASLKGRNKEIRNSEFGIRN